MAADDKSGGASGERGRLHTILGWFDHLIDLLPGRARSTVVLALLFVGIGLISIPVVDPVNLNAVAWVPFIVLFTIAVLLLLYATYQSQRQTAAELIDTTTRASKEAARSVEGVIEERAGELRNVLQRLESAIRSSHRRPPGFALGCRVGRGVVEIGMLQFAECRSDVLPRHSENGFTDVEQSSSAPAFPPDPNEPSQIYDTITSGVLDAIQRSTASRIDYIGLGLPGLVDLRQGTIHVAMRGYSFFNNARITDELAQRLCRYPVVRSKFAVASEAQMRCKIVIDNDVRCAARALLATTYQPWNDFGCLHVGTGVGVSLVLNRNIHYGSRYHAGEIGHSIAHLGEYLDLPSRRMKRRSENEAQPRRRGAAEPLRRLYPTPCSCGEPPAFHFESLLNYGGLTAMANALGGEIFDEVRELYFADYLGRADGSKSENSFRRDGLPSALAWAVTPLLGEPEPQGFHSALQRELGGQKGEALRNYLDTVIDQYARVLAAAVSSLVNTLDLEGIVFCGSLIESIGRQERFREHFGHYLRSFVIAPEVPRLEYDRISELGWRGAALIGRDPGYPIESSVWGEHDDG